MKSARDVSPTARFVKTPAGGKVVEAHRGLAARALNLVGWIVDNRRRRQIEDDLPVMKAIVRRTIPAGDEFVAHPSDGRHMPSLVTATPVFMHNEDLRRATMIVEDVLPDQDLGRLREEWTSIVAHDLQQPINSIVLRADLLLRAGLGDKAREDIGHIRAAARRLSRMVRDLLDVSQLETRGLRVAVTRVDLPRLMQEVLERIPAAASRTKIRTPAHGRLIVLADAERLEQVVTNLLSNALKYSARGTEIWIDIGECGPEAKVSVVNRGSEIPADELPLLFDRFVRSRTLRTRDTRGLGVGLYIAKRLVEAQGGRIWAESGADGMTAFHFTLPLDEGSRISPATSLPATLDGASPAQLRQVPT
jgi:signal transduction histidine kinase